MKDCLVASALTTLPRAVAEDAPSFRSGLGIVMYDCGLRRQWMRKQDRSFDLFAPMTFLEHCRSLGAGGIQVNLDGLSPSQADQLRDRAAELDMFIDAIVEPPGDVGDLARFDASIEIAARVGVQAARTVIIPGRRYEYFKTFEDYQQAARYGEERVRLAVPIVEKHRVRLAIENHKDQRIEDRVALLRRIGSPYIGACVDTGNSFALLDELYGAVEALAPYAFSVHFKDQALKEYDEGFLLGDIPLGQGSFDLKRMAATLRQAQPTLRFSLEVITRDPLRVPCLTVPYWESVAEATGADLARTLRAIRERPVASPIVSRLPLVEQVQLEDAQVAASLAYAARELTL